MLAKIPTPLKWIYPRRLWQHSATEKTIYLTFDDGPIPEVTPWVLEQLDKFSAKGTFFCIGDNIRKHPKLFAKLVAAGHSPGNHTQNHLNGWKTPFRDYLDNVLQAEAHISETADRRGEPKLFRPPYGKLKGRQARKLMEKDYRIVMWDVLSMDYDQRLSGERCYDNVIRNAGPGSIVVFHDSLKAERNLRKTLPGVLEYFSSKGYGFKGL